MARATLTDRTVDWQSFEDDYDLIRDKIEEVFPDLFKNSMPRSADRAAFAWPTALRNGSWRTSTGKARFLVFRGVDEDPPSPHPEMLRLATVRSHDQYNTTIYSMNDRYRGVYGTRTVVFMNKDEHGGARHCFPGARRNRSPQRRRGGAADPRLRGAAYDIPRGSIAAYYPETNPLLALAHHDVKSGNAGGEIDPGDRPPNGRPSGGGVLNAARIANTTNRAG